MQDRPTAAELLTIVAETLSDVVVPATEAHAQHQARVAANLCRIVARELAAPEASQPALQALEEALSLTKSSSEDERLHALAAAISATDDTVASSIHDQVAALVRSKLDVNKPGYTTHDAAAEAAVIA